MAETYTDPKTGKVYNVIRPSGTTPAAAPEQPISTGEDILRSTATGVGEGLHAIPGMIGDLFGVGMLAGRAIDKYVLGNEVEDVATTWDENPLAPITSEALEGYTGFKDIKHDPQTKAGEFFRTGASFAVPGSFAGKATKTAVRGGLTGFTAGLGAEGAGEAADALGVPGAKPYAEMVAALVAGGLGSKATGFRKARTAASRGGPYPKSPSVDQLETDARALEAAAKAQGAVIAPTSVDNEIRRMSGWAAGQGGFDKQLTANTYRVIRRLNRDFTGVGADLSQLRKVRDLIEAAISNAPFGSKDRMYANQLKRQWDDYTERLTVADVPPGHPDPQRALQDIRAARELWHRTYKVKALEDVVRDAVSRVTSGRRIDMDRAIRSRLYLFLKDTDEMRRYSPAEQAAIKEIADGSGTLVQTLSQLAPRGFMGTVVAPGFAGTLGNAVGGKWGALLGAGGTMLTGESARRMARLTTEARLNDFYEAVRAGRVPATGKAPSLRGPASAYIGAEAQAEQAANPPPTLPPAPEEQGPFFDQAGPYKDFNIGAQALARALAGRGYQLP